MIELNFRQNLKIKILRKSRKTALRRSLHIAKAIKEGERQCFPWYKPEEYKKIYGE